ncbi:23S rRNA (guanosine(2251)-2'-O)-methyltransferase RlmB [Actinotalea sp.]|uniref:23S rRNA (guanosine(2251)-2'-O)-methyltransferase RlmB n=1 Tax=Actinotalea sp. TaxID=1872145 RepID=UPI0035630CDF
MAGNSQRRGATRKPGSKKGASVGSGGRNRRGLEGKGPTPKAEDRTYHVAHKRKAEAEAGRTATGGPRVAGSRTADAGTGRPAGPRGTGRGATDRSGGRGAPERSGGRPARQTSREQRPASAGRTRSGKTLAEVVAGRNAVVEALRAGIPCGGVWIAHRTDSDERLKEILKYVGERGLPLLEVTKPELDRLTDGVVHQGVAIQVPPYEYADLEGILHQARRTGKPALIVALDGITDPRNLGAVLRSAGAFGVHGVVVPERRAAGVTASAWKVSAGAAARVPVAQVTNLVRALTELREAGCTIVGLDGEGTMPIGDLSVATEPVVLVVGSEGKGLGRLVRQTCDLIAAIPIRSEVESLNAGVAAGISLYEVSRIRSAG